MILDPVISGQVNLTIAGYDNLNARLINAERGDFDNDGDVDALDLASFADNYGN